MSPGSRVLWGNASRGSDGVGWGLLGLLSMVLNELSHPCGSANVCQMPGPGATLLTLSVAASLGHPSKRTHVEETTSGRQMHPPTHSLSKHLQGSHVKSTVNVYQSNHSLGKIQRRIHNLSSTDVSPPSSTYPGVREKQDICVSLCSPGTSLLGESQASNFVRGSVSQYNLVSLLDMPIKCIYLINTYIVLTTCQASS